MAAADGSENELASRLALFDDEPDINDWFEVALGAAMITMGLHQLFNPGGLFSTGVMQWLGAKGGGKGDDKCKKSEIGRAHV